MLLIDYGDHKLINKNNLGEKCHKSILQSMTDSYALKPSDF